MDKLLEDKLGKACSNHNNNRDSLTVEDCLILETNQIQALDFKEELGMYGGGVGL